MQMYLKGAEEIDISDHAPSTAIGLTVTITIQPPTGVVFVYSSRSLDPIKFNGPRTTKEVPIEGPKIFVQLVQGAKSYHIEFDGWANSI